MLVARIFLADDAIGIDDRYREEVFGVETLALLLNNEISGNINQEDAARLKRAAKQVADNGTVSDKPCSDCPARFECFAEEAPWKREYTQ